MLELAKLDDHLKKFQKEDWSKLFRLIPKIEQAKSFGKVVVGEEIEPGVTQFPYVSCDSLVLEFLEIVYELKLIVVFEWMDWKEGKKILNEQNYENQDLITLCKLLTTIVRADRFSEGFLLSSFKHGDILKILKEIQKQIVNKR